MPVFSLHFCSSFICFYILKILEQLQPSGSPRTKMQSLRSAWDLKRGMVGCGATSLILWADGHRKDISLSTLQRKCLYTYTIILCNVM